MWNKGIRHTTSSQTEINLRVRQRWDPKDIHEVIMAGIDSKETQLFWPWLAHPQAQSRSFLTCRQQIQGLGTPELSFLVANGHG